MDYQKATVKNSGSFMCKLFHPDVEFNRRFFRKIPLLYRVLFVVNADWNQQFNQEQNLKNKVKKLFCIFLFHMASPKKAN